MSKILYNRFEAASALGISVGALDYMSSNGRIAKTKVGRKTLFHIDELNRFAKVGTTESIRPAAAAQQ